MKRSDAFAALTGLKRACDEGDAGFYADRLRDALTEPWVDTVFATQASGAMRGHGIRAPEWSPSPLRIGESWLLLCDRAADAGLAGRILYRQDGLPTHCLGVDARAHADRAFRGLETMLAGMGRGLRHRPAPERFVVLTATPSEVAVHDASLGVAVCAAILSEQLRRAPNDTVAASACVAEDGTLAGVEYLDEKIDALRASWPSVKTLVVAKGQTIPEGAADKLEIRPCRTVLEAMSVFGLDPGAVPRGPVDSLLQLIHNLELENSKPHSIENWRRLSWEAFQASVALKDRAGHEGDSVNARAWAALFALHAGDDARSRELLAPVMEKLDRLPLRPRMFAMIVRASNTIESSPEDAIRHASEAVAAVEPLKDSEPALYGKALGTLGRAYMHRGDQVSAEPRLRAAAEFHESREELRLEGPRSRTYLATCLRMAGRPREALEVLDLALDFIRAHDDRQLPQTTELYVQLERGRALLDTGEAQAALEAFETCLDRQAIDCHYPKLGALRGAALALRMMGRREEADALVGRCLAVAREAGTILLGRVAAVAAGETLTSGLPTAMDERELVRAWEDAFQLPSDRDEIRRVLSTWIY